MATAPSPGSYGFHNSAVVSVPPVTTWPRADVATTVGVPSWPSSDTGGFASTGSQTRGVKSFPPVTSRPPPR